MSEEEQTLSEYHLGFIEGVLYAKGIHRKPTFDEFGEALRSLEAYLQVKGSGIAN